MDGKGVVADGVSIGLGAGAGNISSKISRNASLSRVQEAAVSGLVDIKAFIISESISRAIYGR